MRFIAFALLLLSNSAWSQVEIDKPWVRATPPGAKLAAGYMTIHNKSSKPDRLLGGSSRVAASVETHVHIRDGEILRMRMVPSYAIPARGSFALKPGGAHLMFMGLTQPLKEGDKVPVTLRFEHAGEVQVEFHVGRLTAPSHKH